jgi:dodecin
MDMPAPEQAEETMKRAKKPNRPGSTNVAAGTGRDGAIDFTIKERQLNPNEEAAMEDHIYRVIELVGTSEKSIEDAIQSGIERAHKTIRNLRWFEVARTSGHIERGKVRHFQVTLKVGFTMEDAG